jgi:hypothetical protein
VAVEFVFNTVDALNNTRQGWFVDDLAISAVDPGSGGGGGGGGGTVTDGYWDPVTGVWVGFPDAGVGTPPGAAPGTGTPMEVGTYDANGVFVGSGTGVANPGAPAGTGTAVEVGFTDPATGIYVGSPGTSSSSSGGEGDEGSSCGFVGLEFLLPLGLLSLLRRRR